MLLFLTGKNVSVLLDLLEHDVKSMWMNVQVPLVTMEQPVLIYHKDTGKTNKDIQIISNKIFQKKNCNRCAIKTSNNNCNEIISFLGVIVLMVILVCNVKRKIQIVINNFAQVKPCAEMNLELEIILVFANLVTREMLVI